MHYQRQKLSVIACLFIAAADFFCFIYELGYLTNDSNKEEGNTLVRVGLSLMFSSFICIYAFMIYAWFMTLPAVVVAAVIAHTNLFLTTRRTFLIRILSAAVFVSVFVNLVALFLPYDNRYQQLRVDLAIVFFLLLAIVVMFFLLQTKVPRLCIT